MWKPRQGLWKPEARPGPACASSTKNEKEKWSVARSKTELDHTHIICSVRLPGTIIAGSKNASTWKSQEYSSWFIFNFSTALDSGSDFSEHKGLSQVTLGYFVPLHLRIRPKTAKTTQKWARYVQLNDGSYVMAISLPILNRFECSRAHFEGKYRNPNPHPTGATISRKISLPFLILMIS